VLERSCRLQVGISAGSLRAEAISAGATGLEPAASSVTALTGLGFTTTEQTCGDCQTPRKSYKTAHFVGWKKTPVLFLTGRPAAPRSWTHRRQTHLPGPFATLSNRCSQHFSPRQFIVCRALEVPIPTVLAGCPGPTAGDSVAFLPSGTEYRL